MVIYILPKGTKPPIKEENTMKEMVRELQKFGEFHFNGLSRKDSRRAAEKLVQAAMRYDNQYGINCSYGIVTDAFGYSYAVTL